MADGINEVTLLGNLGDDADLRYTNTDQAICKFRMATTRTYGGGEGGGRREDVQWHHVVVWGNVAEAIAKYLTKGKQVHVRGRLNHRTYDDKDGVKRCATDVVAERVILLGDGSMTLRAARGDEKGTEAGDG